LYGRLDPHESAEFVGCHESDANLPDLLPFEIRSNFRFIPLMGLSDHGKVLLKLFWRHSESIVLESDSASRGLHIKVDVLRVSVIRVVDELLQARGWAFVQTGAEIINDARGDPYFTA
jgi:hypothetical protein